ncbi:hypothetical protein Pcinc_008456 [Petrolisthes cinctipes]|uniref:Uncharacterized protein n=1 Tax=Petrolisthes cinctipes TaxID=88211 RepID=A0AAE1KWF8_PETCI|nr:hypothetical protein Pcinc_008456 [Petrolisthes cinctipes]
MRDLCASRCVLPSCTTADPVMHRAQSIIKGCTCCTQPLLGGQSPLVHPSSSDASLPTTVPAAVHASSTIGSGPKRGTAIPCANGTLYKPSLNLKPSGLTRETLLLRLHHPHAAQPPHSPNHHTHIPGQTACALLQDALEQPPL